MSVPVSIIFLSATMAAMADAAAGNDGFAGRRALPSVESVEEVIPQTAEVSFETLDPVANELSWNDKFQNGTLWWEWTAPRDGWFTAGTLMADGNRGETLVFTGSRLENLMPVRNGNFLGVNHLEETIFQARQGAHYNILVKVTGMTVVPGPEHPAWGTLRLRPSPPPPANDTLDRRVVLSGALPLTARFTNLSGPCEQEYLLPKMVSLEERDTVPFPNGPVQWVEWTCPETGVYELRFEGLKDPATFVAARKQLPGSATAPAGQWENTGINGGESRFHAAAGRVYDFAVMSSRGWDTSTDDSFGDYTLTLKKTAAVYTLPNTTRETAAVMPGTLPSVATADWPGQSEDDLEPVRLWWKFTAPVKGIYGIGTGGAGKLHFQAGRRWPASPVPLLAAGESVFIEYVFYRTRPVHLRTMIELLGVPGGNDHAFQAPDLGPARDFHLSGHGSEATLDLTESPPFSQLPPGAEPGTLWWMWTAPEKGWLRIVDTPVFRVPLEVYTGASPAGDHRPLADALQVEAGRVYLIRAAFLNYLEPDVCLMHLDFLPGMTNLTWQTARDLGATSLPKWNPPGRDPEIILFAKQWFRFTAAESGPYAFLSESLGDIFTNPAVEQQPPWDPVSATWHLEAGQTYWVRTASLKTGAWFELLPELLTTNGDPSTAITLPPDLPAAATAVARGDQNSELEVLRMRPFVWENHLREGMPVLWWKWKPQQSQRARVHAENLSEWAGEVLAVFTGDDTAPGPEVADTTARHDYSGHYINAVAGTTYWFGVAATEGAGQRRTTIRVELWPVADVSPPNDPFSGSRKIDDFPLGEGVIMNVMHTGVPGFGHPLRWEWIKASVEAGEPAVHVFDDDDGNLTEQTATTWFNWKAPAPGIFQYRVTTRVDGPRNVRGGSDPFTPRDLTADLYTGETLAGLQAVTVYEPLAGRYLFRAEEGKRYQIRVASGEHLPFYEFQFVRPSLEDIYDFAAMEGLRFEDVGHAWDTEAGDGIAGIRKLVFGLDPHLPLDHPRNDLLRDRFPRPAAGPEGVLEMRCRPDPAWLPEGNPAAFVPPGRASSDLIDWEVIDPVALANGEVALRHPGTTRTGFLYWEVFPVED